MWPEGRTRIDFQLEWLGRHGIRSLDPVVQYLEDLLDLVYCSSFQSKGWVYQDNERPRDPSMYLFLQTSRLKSTEKKNVTFKVNPKTFDTLSIRRYLCRRKNHHINLSSWINNERLKIIAFIVIILPILSSKWLSSYCSWPRSFCLLEVKCTVGLLSTPVYHCWELDLKKNLVS